MFFVLDSQLSVLDLIYDDEPNATVEKCPTCEDHVSFSLEGIPSFQIVLALLFNITLILGSCVITILCSSATCMDISLLNLMESKRGDLCR